MERLESREAEGELSTEWVGKTLRGSRGIKVELSFGGKGVRSGQVPEVALSEVVKEEVGRKRDQT